jgi:hypothetical protein
MSLFLPSDKSLGYCHRVRFTDASGRSKLRLGWQAAGRRNSSVFRTRANPSLIHRTRAFEPGAEEVFRLHAQEWKEETSHWSSLSKAFAHPSYLRIIGLGKLAVPLLIRELQEQPDHWFIALEAITGVDPVPSSATFDQAVHAWIDWWNHQPRVIACQ